MNSNKTGLKMGSPEDKEWTLAVNLLLTVIEKCGGLKAFHQLSNEERIKFCLTNEMISSIIKSYIEVFRENNRFAKDSIISANYREKGNKEFSSEYPVAALDSYTKSILYAKKGSEEEALSLGNRSAVLFYKKNFKACIADIDEALKIGCEDKMREIKLLMRKGKALMELGQEQGLMKCFIQANKLIKDLKEIPSEKEKATKFENEVDLILKAMMSEKNKNVKKKPKNGDTRSAADKYMDTIQNHFVENPNLKYASIKVGLRESRDKGKYVVAEADIKAGEVLFIEKPFAFAVLPDQLHSVCQYCCSDVDNPISCEGCAEGCYCSKQCLSNAWEKFHSLECGFGVDLMYNIGIGLLALRLAIAGKQANIEDYKKVKSLVTNLDKLNSEDIYSYSLTTSVIVMYLRDYKNYFKTDSETYSFGATVLEHVTRLVCNGHAIVKNRLTDKKIGVVVEEGKRIGTGIFPSSSMMNHSCDPNIFASFIKTTIVIKAIKDIKKGAEVFNCYGPNFRRMSTKERQEALKCQYRFTCDCVMCVRPGEHLDKFNNLWCPHCESSIILDTHTCSYCKTRFPLLKKELVDFSLIKKKVDSLIEENQNEKALEIIKTKMNFICLYVRPYSRLALEVNDLMASTLCRMNNWKESFPHVEHTIYSIKLKFGFTSLEVANEIFKLSDIAVEMVKSQPQGSDIKPMLQRCIIYSQTAMNIYNLYYGPYYEKYSELKARIAFFQMRFS